MVQMKQNLDYAGGIKPGDIGVVQTKTHHFIIRGVLPGGKMPPVASIDGNGEAGMIECRPGGKPPHQVMVDNFNYYTFT